jgi:hypothetical protein
MESTLNFCQTSMPMPRTKTHSLSRRFVPILLCWPLLALAQGAEEIRFRPGEITGTVSGSVSITIKTWQFRARKDQQVTATLLPFGGDKGRLTMTLYSYCGEEYGAPLNAEGLRWQGPLPCTDRYTVDVSPSVEAMREKRVQRYTLNLEIR